MANRVAPAFRFCLSNSTLTQVLSIRYSFLPSVTHHCKPYTVEAALRALKAFSYESRVSKHELCHMLGLSSPRVLQELINQERKTAPICSSASGGYWLGDPESEVGRAEISSTASTMERRAVETFRAAAALRRWTRVPLGQLHIGGEHE